MFKSFIFLPVNYGLQKFQGEKKKIPLFWINTLTWPSDYKILLEALVNQFRVLWLIHEAEKYISWKKNCGTLKWFFEKSSIEE